MHILVLILSVRHTPGHKMKKPISCRIFGGSIPVFVADVFVLVNRRGKEEEGVTTRKGTPRTRPAEEYANLPYLEAGGRVVEGKILLKDASFDQVWPLWTALCGRR